MTTAATLGFPGMPLGLLGGGNRAFILPARLPTVVPTAVPTAVPAVAPTVLLPAVRASCSSSLLRQQSLPCPERKLIGAWCFVEFAGMNNAGNSGSQLVSTEPHAGLQAFTWMIEGEMLHRDRLGNEQVIRSGEINLLTTGSGMAHTERLPAKHSPHIQMAQLWIALPNAMRQCEPAFAHYSRLPKRAFGGFDLTLLIGNLFGDNSPVPVHSPLIAIELITNGAASTTIPLRGDFEYGVLVLAGEAVVAGERVLPGSLFYIGEHHTRLDVHCEGPASLLLLGGKPLNESPIAP